MALLASSAVMSGSPLDALRKKPTWEIALAVVTGAGLDVADDDATLFRQASLNHLDDTGLGYADAVCAVLGSRPEARDSFLEYVDHGCAQRLHRPEFDEMIALLDPIGSSIEVALVSADATGTFEPDALASVEKPADLAERLRAQEERARAEGDEPKLLPVDEAVAAHKAFPDLPLADGAARLRAERSPDSSTAVLDRPRTVGPLTRARGHRRRPTRSASRSGDSGDDGSGLGDPDPARPPARVLEAAAITLRQLVAHPEIDGVEDIPNLRVLAPIAGTALLDAAIDYLVDTGVITEAADGRLCVHPRRFPA